MAGTLKRINILLTQGLLEEVKRVAKREGKTVSEYIRETLKRVIEEEKFGKEGRLSRIERLRRRRQSMPKLGDSSEIIREWREKGW